MGGGRDVSHFSDISLFRHNYCRKIETLFVTLFRHLIFPTVFPLQELVGSVSLKKWQNSAFYDRAFKLGGDVLWTNINDLRYGAKKNLQWTHENLHHICNTRNFSFLRPHKHC